MNYYFIATESRIQSYKNEIIYCSKPVKRLAKNNKIGTEINKLMKTEILCTTNTLTHMKPKSCEIFIFEITIETNSSDVFKRSLNIDI